ncbi:MAG: glycosyltransferase family 2 protein, partial [Actinomycetota bacterium]|nr:glycosyltransferase family 2 protein [Actinomycetota bacterium]
WSNKSLFMNPKYGTLGLLAVPYFFFFEVLGPVVELTGFFLLIVALYFNFVNVLFAGLFLAVAILYGILLSILSLLIEEVSFHRYNKWKFLYQAVVSSIIENFGFRQMHAYWRLEGVFQALRRTDRSWEAMPRKGLVSDQSGSIS